MPVSRRLSPHSAIFHSIRASTYNPLARAAAIARIEWTPACPEAHAVLAHMKADARDFKAPKNFPTGHCVGSNYPPLIIGMGGILLPWRMDEGLKELRTALRTDPLSPIIHATIPAWQSRRRQFDQAVIEVEM